MATKSTARCATFVFIHLLCAIGIATAARGQNQPATPTEVSQWMQDRDYQKAVGAIDKALQNKPESPDYLRYLRGRALHFQGLYDEAIAAFDELEKLHPKSEWARKARFAKGIASARKGDFQPAELIYRDEANFLLSDERKQGIAAIYRGYADAFFKPSEESQEKPNYDQAFDFYRKALAVAPKGEDQIEIELRMARCRQLSGKHANAADRYAQFLNEHKQSAETLEAQYQLGDSLLAAGEPVAARLAWRKLLAADAEGKSTRTAEAAFKMSLTFGIPTPPSPDDMSMGIRSLEEFIERFPEHEKISTAHLRIAQSYQNSGRYDDAVKRFLLFLSDPKFEQREDAATARYLLGHAYKMQGRFEAAAKAWETFLTKHPTHQLWNEAQREIIDAKFLRAQAHYAKEQYAEARQLWTAFIAQHPLDARNIDLMFRFGEMHFASKQWEAAISDWRRLVAKHPQSDQASKAQLMIARTLEQEGATLSEALAEYKKLDWGPHVSDANTAIERMTSKSLIVETDRVFRSDETPRLAIASRNIEQVKVRVYSLDLETYFRKTHLASAIERLDIALIDPDRAFDFKTPDYREFAELKSAIETPLTAPPEGPVPTAGVMAVTVSSKTLEATSLVVQSDLDIIVKLSRNEVFVFAENMRTGEAWPGTRVLLSDGNKVFAEGETGEDGVFRTNDKRLHDANNVRIFAISGRHIASNMASLQGVGVVSGLSNKGYIYTERPTYRPGQVVHVRGVIRSVKGDAYQTVKGKTYKASVFDGRNRRLVYREVELNDFGAFHFNFQLPTDSRQGDYNVQISDANKAKYLGAFRVREFVTPEVELTIDAKRSIYFRGEVIEGTIQAAYRYGSPLAGRTIRYRAAGGPIQTVTCDQHGRVAFRVETLDQQPGVGSPDSQIVTIEAELPELGLQAARAFYLAPRGYTLSASTVRSEFLAGETFDVTVRAVDPAGQPVSKELTLSVMQAPIGVQDGERLVKAYDLKTDEKGLAHQTLKLDEGAHYVLRFDGKDRFGNLVSAAANVEISADDDLNRLRILADQHTAHVGEQVRVNLHWREKPALALMTFEGAEILDYRLIRLKTGSNKLQLPITAKLAPNFQLGVAVMTNGPKEPTKKPFTRFHHVASQFQVQRDLQVRIDLPQLAAAKPGESLRVKINTTDRSGAPVAAEVGLAMVESSLGDRWKPLATPITNFFRGGDRTLALATLSSINFAYRPKTAPIDAMLLAETDREKLLNAEQVRIGAMRQGGRFGRWAGFGGGAFGRGPSGGSPSGSDPFGGEDGGLANTGDQPASVTVALPALKLDNTPPVNLSLVVSQSQSLGNGEQTISAGKRPALKAQGKQAAQIDPKIGRETTLDVAILGDDGVWSYRELSGELTDHRTRQAALETLRRTLAKQDVRLMDGLRDHETGYWNPSIVTDAKGQATVEIRLPRRSTKWRFSALGVSKETLTGGGEVDLQVREDLFGHLTLPSAFYAGDKAKLVASVHNHVIEKGQIDVELRITIGEKTTTLRRKIEVTETGVKELQFEHAFELPAGRNSRLGEPGAVATFEMSVISGERRDDLRRSAPILVDGSAAFSIASGSATGDTSATVAPLPAAPLSEPRLQIIVGPTVKQSLMDSVLAPPTWCQTQSARVASPLDELTSELMASLALREWAKKTTDNDDPRIASLDAKIRSALTALAVSQNKDGGWSWANRKVASDAFATARVVWTLNLAKQAGYNPGNQLMSAATGLLELRLSQTAVTDYETKAVLLHALAEAGEGDFPLVNQLFRNRQSLGSSGLAYLSLACAAMDRKQTAKELLALLKKTDLDSLDAKQLPSGGSQVELRALFALGLESIEEDDALPKQVDWLMSHRTGYRWSPLKATGPAVLALSRWYGGTELKRERYQLKIVVNEQEAKVLDVRESLGTQVIDVPPGLLGDGEQRVRFELTGRGRFTYQCVLGGHIASNKIKSTTKNWIVNRYYEPAQRELDGEGVPRGFRAVAGAVKRFRNSLNNLPHGQRGVVEIQVERPKNTGGEPNRREYLVVTEPLPAGTKIVENSISGSFERYIMSPGEITFFIGDAAPQTIRFEVHGNLVGDFRAPPTIARNAYRLDEFAVAKPAKLSVLAKGKPNPDVYRLSPDELLALGKRQFAKGEFEYARDQLTDLVDNWDLKTAVYRDTVKMLLDIHLETGPADDVVKYFEIIIEKYPNLPIPFEDYLKIAAAYDAIQEFERSYLVFRATVEKSFMRESFVAGSLEGQGDFSRSVEFMSGLLRDYPPEPYTAAASYALAQRIYAKAPNAAEAEKLKLEGVKRIDLVEQSLDRLNQFLTHHPDDPAADKAAFSFANGLLGLDAYPAAIAACERFAKRYPKSEYLDSYWYVIGFCQFAEGDHKAALEMCEKVSRSETVDPETGTRSDSRNKWRAIYILGQIHHSLGEPREAIREYERVKERFVDAKQAIDYFSRKQIELPEVTTVMPGKPAAVELKHRNVSGCEVTVYRIDLLKFSVLRRNLGGISNINLAGIRAQQRQSIELGDGKDYRDRQTKIEFALKEQGAYLVVCRGDDLHSSGLVLVSDLMLEVQEDRQSGRVRATVRESDSKKYVRDVYVKIIGSWNSEFSSGDTDLRGVFVADSIQGRSTVIARADDSRYAFYRGAEELGARPPGSRGFGSFGGQQRQPQGKKLNKASNGKDALLQGLMEGAKELQNEQVKELEELYKGLPAEGQGGGMGGGMGGFGGGGFGGGGVF